MWLQARSGRAGRGAPALPAAPADPNILVGHERFDDAAVYRLGEDLAVVATLDFMTPVVDDPETFGAIAATNAVSDVFAMGARPVLALAIAAYPKEADPDVLAAIMRGGASRAAELGCPVLGGHTVDDPEPKYGLSVVGVAHPDELMTNDAGRPGELLVLTKPLGTGLAAQAARATGRAELVGPAVAAMLRANGPAAEVARRHGLRCATDVTGFGLLGHLREVAAASGLSAHVDAGAVPLLPDARRLASDGHAPGGAERNRRSLGTHVAFDPSVPGDLRTVLFDPQTSGGLLLAVPPRRRDAVLLDLARDDVGAAVIGHLQSGPGGRIDVGA